MVPTFTCGFFLSNLSFAMDRQLLSIPLCPLGLLVPFAGSPDPCGYLRRLQPETDVSLLLNGAADGNRTRDLFLTKEVLYRLSHSSLCSSDFVPGAFGDPSHLETAARAVRFPPCPGP